MGLSQTGGRRAVAFAVNSTFANVTRIWTSPERKARNTADLFAAPRTLPVNLDPRLGENDRSATGFLSAKEFEAPTDAFFDQPETSFRGWETAMEAQQRIDQAVAAIVATHDGGDLAVVTHGTVGTLLWCALSRRPIIRRHDQPAQGHYWLADLPSLKPRTSWLLIG